ncbi:MAG: PorT family protein [Hymenobacteraceae bacterium]|nr:PorT family protein [Hymenobacteraceae bacterium]
MKQLYILLFTLLVSSSVIAQANFQPGYILMADGSKQVGQLDYKSDRQHARSITFKSSSDAVSTKYSPNELAGYGFEEGKRYESANVMGPDSLPQQNFLEVLVKGGTSLYFMKTEESIDRFFIRKNGGALQELSQEKRRIQEESGAKYTTTLKHYVGTLNYLFLDCPTVQPQLERTRLEQASLIKLVSAYNTCTAPAQEQFVKEAKSGLIIEKGLVIGASITNANFSSGNYFSFFYLEDSDIAASVDVSGGIFFNIGASKINENFRLHTGAMFYRYSGTGKFERHQSAEQYDKFHYEFEASYLKIPVMVRYTLPGKKIQPFLSAGLQNGFLLSGSSQVEKESKWHDRTTIENGEMFSEFRFYEQGIQAGLGMQLPYYKEKNLSVELRYERNNGFSPYKNIRQVNQVASVFLGMAF